MDVLAKMKAFVATAELGTFSDAARAAGVSASVIMKRINELEDDFGVVLFTRSTRSVAMTDVGQLYLPRIRRMVKEYEDLRAGTFRAPGKLEGPLRVKALTFPTLLYFGSLFAEFRLHNPGLQMTVVTSDLPGDPAEEGFDMAIGTDLASYEGVVEELLHPYPRLTCASPAYLDRKGAPQHPRDLLNHECLGFSHGGSVWSFQTPNGTLNVDVHPAFATNNPRYLCDLACSGAGIVQLSMVVAKDAVERGLLVPLLNDFPLVDRWLKVLIPESRVRLARVQALLDKIKAMMTPEAPWARDALIVAAAARRSATALSRGEPARERQAAASL